MLSTVLTVGGCIAVCAGVAYIVYQYFPLLVEFYNSCIDQLYTAGTLLPDWLVPYVSVAALLAGFSLIVKLL